MLNPFPERSSSLNIFVRNLSHEVSEEDLWDCFAPYGRVTAVTLIGCEMTV